MKNAPLLLFLVAMAFPTLLIAQPDTVVVPADSPPGEGNLNAAVQTARTAGTLSRTVFKLELGENYVLPGTIEVQAGEHLTIVAPEPGSTQASRPPRIVLSDTATSGFTHSNFRCFGTITLKNIWLLFSGSHGQLNLQIEDSPDSVNGQRGEFDGVIFDASTIPWNASGAVGISARHFKGTFRNCYFRNCADAHYRYYGRALSFPYAKEGLHSDSVLFENCTFDNMGYVYEQESGNYADFVKFNHCTFVNVVMYPLESGWWKTLSVTNSIFLNTWMYGAMPGYVDGGTIRIDSIATFGFDVPFDEQDRRVLFAYSSYGLDDWLREWMDDNPASVWWYQHGEDAHVPIPQPMLSPGTLRFFDSTNTDGTRLFPYMNRVALYDSANPGFILPPTDTAALKSFLYHRWWDSVDTAWAFRPEVSLQGSWPFPENLAFTNPVLAAGAMGGYPLGDLYRWWPEQYALWKAQQEEEDARLAGWLEYGIDPLVSVGDGAAGIHPQSYELFQNYPNPFNPSTTISFFLPRDANVSLAVFDLLGRKVATIASGVLAAGAYSRQWDAEDLPSGVYLCQLRAGTFVQTRKMLLLK